MDTGSLKRIGATVAGIAAVLLNRKFGLQLTEVDIATIGVIVTGYVAQSGYKAAKAQGATVQE